MAWHPSIIKLAKSTTPVVLLILCACTQMTGKNTPLWTRSALYFGLQMPQGQVAAQAFQDFLNNQVSKAFDNFTVIDATGRWRNREDRLIKEPTKILIIVHDGSKKNLEKIDKLRTWYEKQFQQESVMHVRQPVQASF